MRKVQLKKLNSVEDPLVPTPDKDDYKPGQHNRDKSVPIDYTVTGTLVEDVAVGSPIRIERDTRNGKEVYGAMITSLVQNIRSEGNTLYINTDNSVYELTYLEEQ